MISGRGEGALLAWKLGSKRLGVNVVVALSNGVGGGSRGVYRKEKGGNSKYNANIFKHRGMARLTQCWRCSNVVLGAMPGAEIHPGMNCQLRVITDSATGGGLFHVCSVRGI